MSRAGSLEAKGRDCWRNPSIVYPIVYPSAIFFRKKLRKPLRHKHNCKKCPTYPQKRTCAVQLPMSALGQKRTHAAQRRGLLFDHFVGAGEQLWGNLQSDLPCRLEIDR